MEEALEVEILGQVPNWPELFNCFSWVVLKLYVFRNMYCFWLLSVYYNFLIQDLELPSWADPDTWRKYKLQCSRY